MRILQSLKAFSSRGTSRLIMLLIIFNIPILIIGLVLGVSGRGIIRNEVGKQLFLSRRVVTETAEFDGGILVDENGVIESILTKESVDVLLQGDSTLSVFDGGNLVLMAGAIDSHVHVNEPGRTSWEGFVTATQAAAVGGFTTIVDMPLNSNPPTTSLKNLKIKASAAKEEVFVDVAFWGGAIPNNTDEYATMIDAGVIGFKGYLIDSGIPEFPYLPEDEIENVFAALNGTDIVLAFHSELNDSNYRIDYSETNINSTEPFLYETYLASRPPVMELDAVSLLSQYIEQYDVHVHVVHVSAEGVVPILEEAREKRISSGNKRWRGGVTAETCYHYLTISSEQIPPGHTEYKCSPPIRNQTNKEKLWQYIKEHRLDLVVSDHSPSVASLKGTDFLTAWGGISSVQFGISLFWTEAKARGYDLSIVSRYMSSGPAKLAGLSTKGELKPGYDADFIYFDPDASFIVTPDIIMYKNKISPYMHKVLQGSVVHTYLRGKLIASDGDVINKPQGELLINEDLIFGKSK